MGRSIRRLVLGVCGMAVVPLAGCALVPKSRLDQAQAYNRELQAKNQQLAADLDQARGQAQDMASRTVDLENRLNGQDELVANYQQRMSDWDAERVRMQQQYNDLLAGVGRQGPLPAQVRNRLSEFAARHPQFVEVDPDTGISKFRSDVLFPTGKAELGREAQQVLQEFANIFRDESGKPLRLMVVGHTDDRRIARTETKAQHPTNWHLSVHRAVAVEQYLEQAGIEPDRMGVTGYGQHQPVAANAAEPDRQQNRRVEIFVLAPEAPIVGRSDTRRQ